MADGRLRVADYKIQNEFRILNKIVSVTLIWYLELIRDEDLEVWISH